MFEKYFTLKRNEGIKQTTLMDENGEEMRFKTFEEAYRQMVHMHNHSLPGLEPFWGIYQTTVSCWNGAKNTMTQPVWS